MKTRKKILLTGASGTVGYEVLKQLCQIKNEFEVTVFFNKLLRQTFDNV